MQRDEEHVIYKRKLDADQAEECLGSTVWLFGLCGVITAVDNMAISPLSCWQWSPKESFTHSGEEHGNKQWEESKYKLMMHSNYVCDKTYFWNQPYSNGAVLFRNPCSESDEEMNINLENIGLHIIKYHKRTIYHIVTGIICDKTRPQGVILALISRIYW